MKKAFILGDPNSVFPRELAEVLHSHRVEAKIVTRFWSGERVLPDGTPVLASSAHETPSQKRSYHQLQRNLERFENFLIRQQRERYERVLKDLTYRPTFTPFLINALSIARLVRSIKPDFVCGQEVSAYGLATAWCFGIPRILMPWGGDIFIYSETTTMARLLTTYALRQVDLVVTGAVTSIPYIASRFGVDLSRIHFSSGWRLDRHQFRRALPEARRRICEQFKIPSDALIVMNVRRFLPAWGSDVALESFLRFATNELSAHFVLLGGPGTEGHTAAARERVRAEGHADRFVILESNQPLSVCAKLMSVADIFVSLIRKRDMRSASVLQAAAAGGAPIVSDQSEYRCMENEGFKALFVDGENANDVVLALQKYANNPTMRSSVASANQIYLTTHADGEMETRKLLQKIDEICNSYR
jgi:glycosyltransferase involved in cell wall biosynthesis